MKANLEGIRFANDKRDGELLFDFDNMDFVADCLGGTTTCPILQFLVSSCKLQRPFSYRLVQADAVEAVLAIVLLVGVGVVLVEMVFKVLGELREVQEFCNN